VTAQDAAGNVGPASNSSTATTPVVSTAVSVDKIVNFHQTAGANTINASGLTTTGSNELLVAFVTSDGPNTSGATSFSGIAGGGLTWQLKQRTNTQAGTAEIWTAVALSLLTNVTITATRTSGSAVGSMTIVAFKNARAATGAMATANAGTGSPSISLTTTVTGSWVWGVGNDWDSAIARTVGSGQTKVDEFLAPVGDTFWVQSQSAPGGSAGTLVTLNDTNPTTDRWNLAAIEILPQ
jgi:hypothetical protein